MRRKLSGAIVGAVAVALIAAAGVAAVTIRGNYGDFSLSTTVDVTPHALPAKSLAPVTMTSIIHAKQRGGGEVAGLKTVVFQVDKHGSVGRKGVPVCTEAKLAEATPAQARERCAGALVGTGTGRAKVELPGQAAVEISSPLSLFNGPVVGGRPTLLAHAYETLPKPQALVIPIAIEREHNGRYGYRAKVQVPPIAEGYGEATFAEVEIGRVFSHGSKKTGYFNASCSGGRLQVHGTATFTNGNIVPSTLVVPCHTPG